jgi:GntR family transcriptional regulator, transcriptional repressor for pyruvate dehydrogenase complex
MTLAALPRRKIRDEVAQQIKQLIASKRLGCGDRLPNENELAEKFGVSRLSVREATKALEFIGIVESKTGVGLAVGQIDLVRVTDHLGFHPSLHRADPRQLIDSRVIVETGVLPHVVRRMAGDALICDALQAIIDQFRSARSVQTWIDLDIQFHRTLLEASGLAPLVAFGDLLQVFFQRFRGSVKRAEWKTAIDSHQRILDRLCEQDVASAIDELRQHIESHKQRLGSQA